MQALQVKRETTARFVQKWENHLKAAQRELEEIDLENSDLLKVLDSITNVVDLLTDVQRDAVAEMLARYRRPDTTTSRR